MSSKSVSLQTKFVVPIVTVSFLFLVGSMLYFIYLKNRQEERIFSDIQKNLHIKVDLALSQKGDIWIANALQIATNPAL